MHKTTDDYSAQSTEDTAGALHTDAGQGLSAAEVAKRLKQYGYNEIEEKEEPLWHRVFRRFWGPIPWMIEIAAILSAIVQKWDDFTIIMIMLLVNAFLDFFQEHRALNALKTLKQGLPNKVIVLREGQFITIPARELVPGDVVKLKIGDIVPADVQLLKGDYLLVDQAAMTGESLPASKKINEVTYAKAPGLSTFLARVREFSVFPVAVMEAENNHVLEGMLEARKRVIVGRSGEAP